MKILHVLPSMNFGGLQKFVCNLAEEQIKLSHSVEILVLSMKKKEDLGDSLNGKIEIKYIEEKYYNNRFILFIITYFEVINKNPDIIHSHGNSLFYLLFPILRKKNKFVHTMHNMCEFESGKLRRVINKYLFINKYVNVVSISSLVSESIRKYYKITNPMLIYNGLKKPEISNNYEPTEKFIKSIKKGKNTKVLINLGRLDSQKNQILLIDTVINLIDIGYDIKLLILGSFDENSLIYKKIKERTYLSNDIYILGLVNNPFDYLINANLFCLSSKFEGMPISIIEAVAAGVIVVTTPTGGSTDILNENYGYISNDWTVQSYQETLISAITNSKNINKKDLVTRYENIFDMKICTINYIKYYNSI